LVEQVLCERQQDRAGTSTERLADRLGHHSRDVGWVGGFGGPFREATDRRDLVDLLKRLVTAVGPLDLADEREHRGRVLAGRMDPDREVRGAHAPGAEAGGGPARELAVRLGHERSATFVAGGHDADARVTERVEQAEE
jgi:hypothetical protein